MIASPPDVVHCLGVSARARDCSRTPIVLIVALCVIESGCSSSSANPPETPADKSTSASEEQTPEEPKSEEPAGATLTGDAIGSWFEGRGAKLPGAVDPAQTECRTVSAPVPSKQALWCEQRSAIKPWVNMTRTILYDVRDGRTLLLVNLLSRVAAGDAAPGKGCDGALVALKIELGSGGQSLTVADDSGCACAGTAEKIESRAASSKGAGKADAAEALEHQAQQVKAACAQLGAYKWDEHGYMPAK